MPTRRELVGRGAAAALLASPARGQTPWEIPSDEAIRSLLADRLDVQRRGVGLVIGVIEPAGRRIVTHGVSGARNGRALGRDTAFQIGSVTKTFTTLLLADMVQRGEVALDDPAARYLPSGVKMIERGQPITLAHLATHMSGLPGMPTNFDLKADPNPIEAYTPADLYAFLSGHRPEREPGAAYLYSNLGVSLLGRLLGRRLGMEYEALIAQRVLRPLGLASTSIALSADQKRRLAPGHDQYRQPVDTWEMTTLQASGSLRSTADDLLDYLSAHLGYRQTPLAAAMDFQRRQPRPPNGPNQTLGWGIRRDAAGEITLGHSGGKSGYRTFIAFSPEHRRGVVVLANARSQDSLDPLGLHLLAGRPLPPTTAAADPPAWPPVVRPSQRLRAAYEGLYRTAGDTDLVVACKGARLLLETPGEDIVEFFSAGGHRFFSKVSDDRIAFQLGSSDRAAGFTGRLAGKDVTAAR